jgi:hypothetical protein
MRRILIALLALGALWLWWRRHRQQCETRCQLQQSRQPFRVASLRASTTSGPGTDRLAANEALGEGQALTSPNGKYTLAMQGDGNLVLYADLSSGSPSVKWATYTQKGQSTDTTRFVLQSDLNLVVYLGAGTPLWSAASSLLNGKIAGPPTLVLQDDGNLVLYGAESTVIWSIATGLFCPASVVPDNAALYPFDNPALRPPTIPGLNFGSAPDDLASFIGQTCSSVVRKYVDYFHMNASTPSNVTFGDAAKATSLRLDVIAYILRHDPSAAYINWAYALINDFSLHIAPGFADEPSTTVAQQYGAPFLAPPLPFGNGTGLNFGYLATYVYQQYTQHGSVLFHPLFMAQVYGWQRDGNAWTFTARTPMWAYVRLLRFIDHEGWSWVDRVRLSQNILKQFNVGLSIQCSTGPITWISNWATSTLPLADPVRGVAALFVKSWVDKNYPEAQRQPPMQTVFDQFGVQPWRTLINLVKSPNVCVFQWLVTVAPTPWTDLVTGAPDGAWFMPILDIYQFPFVPYNTTYYPHTGLIGYWNGTAFVNPEPVMPANLRAYIEAFALRGKPKTDKAAFARIIIDFYQIDVNNPSTTSKAGWVVNKTIPYWCMQQITLLKSQVVPSASQSKWNWL